MSKSLLALAALLLAPITSLHAADVSAPALATRELVLDKQFLLLPIGTAPNPDYHMTISVDGEKIHDFFIDLGVDTVGWWTHIDVSFFLSPLPVNI